LTVRELAAQIPCYAGKSRVARALVGVGVLGISNSYHANHPYDRRYVAHSPPRNKRPAYIHYYDAVSITTLDYRAESDASDRFTG
jgi:hypothetical protein